MNIQTYDLVIYFDLYQRHYYNISRVAVNRFIAYHRESNPDFEGCNFYAHEQLTSH
jgi:hypothetical protein